MQLIDDAVAKLEVTVLHQFHLLGEKALPHSEMLEQLGPRMKNFMEGEAIPSEMELNLLQLENSDPSDPVDPQLRISYPAMCDVIEKLGLIPVSSFAALKDLDQSDLEHAFRTFKIDSMPVYVPTNESKGHGMIFMVKIQKTPQGVTLLSRDVSNETFHLKGFKFIAMSKTA